MVLQHQARMLKSDDDEDVQHLIIRRKHLFPDALKAFKRSMFDVSKHLRVRFLGESAQDEGGPRREFFRYLTPAFGQSALFCGWPERVIPVHNVSAVVANDYYTVGKMISTCIIQGGQPPICFAPPVAEFLSYGRIQDKYCLKDIPDFECRQLMEKV